MAIQPRFGAADRTRLTGRLAYFPFPASSAGQTALSNPSAATGHLYDEVLLLVAFANGSPAGRGLN
jgi:hypothetical protein